MFKQPKWYTDRVHAVAIAQLRDQRANRLEPSKLQALRDQHAARNG